MAYSRCYYDRYNRYSCYQDSAWNRWVRYLVAGLIIVAFFLLFFMCSCLTARRRRKAGQTPFYGTGWAARPPAYNESQNMPPYNSNNNTYAANPAPPYTPSNGGYYGKQNNGVDLQSPQPAYTGPGQEAYAPPPGPPPGRNDGGYRV